MKGHGFVFFAMNIDEKLNGKYTQKLVDFTEKSAPDKFKNDLKKVIQKTAVGTCDLIGFIQQ